MNSPVDVPGTVGQAISFEVVLPPASPENNLWPANGVGIAPSNPFALAAGNHAFTEENHLRLRRPPAEGDQYWVQRRASEPSNDRGWVSPWYSKAMEEFEGIDEEVAEDELPEIAKEVKEDAKTVLEAIAARGFQTHPSVYPTDSGEIALYFRSAFAASSVLIEIGKDGRTSFFASSGTGDRCAVSGSAEDVLGSLLWRRLRRLESQT